MQQQVHRGEVSDAGDQLGAGGGVQEQVPLLVAVEVEVLRDEAVGGEQEAGGAGGGVVDFLAGLGMDLANGY